MQKKNFSFYRYPGNVLIFCSILLLFAGTSFAGDYVSVKKDGIRIRSAPNTDAEILWEVFEDFPLEIINKDGEWIQTVDFEGDKGWIFNSLTSDKKTAIIKVKTANMRIGPGTAYEVMASVKYGVVFNVIDKEGPWIKVSHEDGTVGWVHNSLIWPSDP
ncbi:MAG: SH3 domain-containing protein [Proteobacteria bacterium]|nr:SH3 domain-containing protein [Pseudomonadota bacterium]MBU1711070.1 SH3 domain-containing protein [Pseudomonadota bacterium]